MSASTDFSRKANIQHTVGHDGCCTIVPQYIFDHLSILNGVDIPIAAHAAIAPAAIAPAAANIFQPERRINIRKTMPFIRLLRINREASYLLNPPPALPKGILVKPAAAAIAPNTFPVFDLNGATAFSDLNGDIEYEIELKNPTSKLAEPDTGWPLNAKNARMYARRVDDFFRTVFSRNSLDDNGMEIRSCVRLRACVIHYDPITGTPKLALDAGGNRIKIPESNAMWDGRQIAYGEGDGMVFCDFTLAQDIVGHELTHGVTQHTCNLRYQEQSGALNEHISDVFGVIFKHWNKGMNDPKTANWLIGEECLKSDFQNMVLTRKFGYWNALRSMSAPGTAYQVTKDSNSGIDPQPDHMNNYVVTPDDNGGVHYNSGIPNKAFYLFATKSGGPSWQIPGHVWYTTILESKFGKLQPNPASPVLIDRVATFREFAVQTVAVAHKLYGDGAADYLTEAWSEVGVV